MHMPVFDDTIVAISSGWQTAALGIVRLSGVRAFELLSELGAVAPLADGSSGSRWNEARLKPDDDFDVPATVLWFRAPRSYTGQDVAEIHTVGSLPLLRAASARLIELGGRRALPGEFTARAFLNGKLDADQVERVLALISAEDQTAARQAARVGQDTYRARVAAVNERLVELIALVEAGIDFVEEEDVRFITPAELARSVDDLIQAVAAIRVHDPLPDRAAKPHITLAGLPNAGKSTLFNALLGYGRAIVSPVLGTTRDVLSAEVQIEDMAIVLQDCAGRGVHVDKLEAAAHLAAEQAADHADLVLWVHDGTVSWSEPELEACRRISESRRILVVSKIDCLTSASHPSSPMPFAATVPASGITGVGLELLRDTIHGRLGAIRRDAVDGLVAKQFGAVLAGLRRARELSSRIGGRLATPELVAQDLREAWEALEAANRGPLAEQVLGKILASFCVGK